MAAFDKISRVQVKTMDHRPYDDVSMIDLRHVRLPKDQGSSDFDPRMYRHTKHPLPLWMAYLNLLKMSFGSGVLGIPLAMCQTGLILGPILSLFIGFLLIHTQVTLLNMLTEVCKRLRVSNISYRHAFRLALLNGPPICQSIGNHGAVIITVIMLINQLGICTTYVISTSNGLRVIMDWESNRSAQLALFLPYILLSFFMTDMKIVSFVSFLGFIVSTVGFLIVTYMMLQDPRYEYNWGISDTLPIMFTLGALLFNYSSVGVIINMDKVLENSEMMVRPKGVIRVGLGFSVVFSTIFGVLGDWSMASSEENILFALPYDSPASMVAIALYLVSIIFTYPLQSHPAVSMILDTIQFHDDDHEPSEQCLRWVETICRPVFVILTFLIAYKVPFPYPIIAFVGCLCTTLLSLVFPALMEVCLMYPGPFGLYNIHLIKDLFIIFFGLTIWLVGIVYNAQIINIRIIAAKSPNNPEYV